jgi:hypothetical protein
MEMNVEYPQKYRSSSVLFL